MTYHITFLQFTPSSFTAAGYYQMGLQLYQRKSPIFTKAATQAFSRAIELDACCWDAYLMRAKLRLQSARAKVDSGVTIGLRKKLIKCIDDFTKYLLFCPPSPDVHLLRAKAYLLLIRYDKYAPGAFLEDFDTATRLGGDTLELKPQLAWVGLQASRNNGDYTNALHYLDLAYNGNYDHNYFIRRSVIFEEMGKSEEAAADLLRASSKSILSTAYEKAALFVDAEKVLLDQISLAPQNIWPKIRLAQFYERLDDSQSAIDTYQFVLQQLASSHRYYEVIRFEINRLSSHSSQA
jgi:hypothetical protein